MSALEVHSTQRLSYSRLSLCILKVWIFKHTGVKVYDTLGYPQTR